MFYHRQRAKLLRGDTNQTIEILLELYRMDRSYKREVTRSRDLDRNLLAIGSSYQQLNTADVNQQCRRPLPYHYMEIIVCLVMPIL